MRIKLHHITPLLAAGAAAVAIAAAPTAAAAPQSCVNLGGSTLCQTPGNVQIYTSPPAAQISGANPFSTYGPFFYYGRGHGHR